MNKQKPNALNKRWLIIIAGLLIQTIVITIASISLFHLGQPDITLEPVAGNPNVCRITHVAPFTDSWVNGIQPGMLVHAAPGPFPGIRTREVGTLLNCQPTSQSIFLQVIDQNTILHLNTSPQSISLTQLLLAVLLAIIFNLTGITIYLRANDRPIARVAYGLFYFTSLIFLLLYAQNTLWINVLLYILGLITWGMATTFVCLLPHPPRKQSSKHNLPISPYAPLVIGIALTTISLPVIVFLPWARPLASLVTSVYSVVCMITIGWVMFWGLRRLNRGEKQIIRMVAVGIVFFLLALALNHNVILYSSFVLNSFVHLFTVPLLLLPIVCGYALIRHQFLGTTSLLSRQVMRVLLWLLLASFFIVPAIILIRIIQNNIPDIQDYCYAALLLLSLWLFPLLWNAIRNVGDQVFYHDFYEYNRSLGDLSTELTRLQHLDEICTFVLPRLATLLNATGVTLLVRTQGHSKGNTNTGHLVQPWHVYLNEEQPFLPIDHLTGIANLALTHLKHYPNEPLLLDGVLVLALYDGNHLSGFLCLGPKLNFEPYSRQDKSFLATLAAQLSVLEVNSRYLEQAEADAQKLTALNRRVVSAQEDERKHLALELHDEVLQQAMLLVRQLSDAGNMTDVAEAMPLARSLVTGLRQTCLELRPPLLDELGLEEALHWLARQTEQRAERTGSTAPHITVTCTGTSNIRLPDDVELASYRVVQEALSNIIKHARATKVTIRLRYTPCSGISLLICDNGRGFIKGKPASERLGLVGMHERMTAIGGHLHLRTHPGRGTTIRATYRPICVTI